MRNFAKNFPNRQTILPRLSEYITNLCHSGVSLCHLFLPRPADMKFEAGQVKKRCVCFLETCLTFLN